MLHGFLTGKFLQVRHSGVPLDNQTSVDGAANTTAALERPSVQYHVHVRLSALKFVMGCAALLFCACIDYHAPGL